MPLLRPAVAIAILAFGGPFSLAAQATDAGIGGLVADSAGRPLGLVEVALVHRPSGRHFAVTTDPGGRFWLFELPLGGPWLARFRRIGYQPVDLVVPPLGIGDRRRLDVRLAAAPIELMDLAATGRAESARPDRIGGSTVIDSSRIRALPIGGRNFADLAALSPWAGPQLSLGGQRWTGTAYRLDGLRARNGLRGGESNGGPFGVPLEAIREFEVATSVFDVTQDRQGGGEVAAVTLSGTNRWESTGFATYRSEALAAPEDYQGRGRAARPFSVIQWGGRLSGPLARDRLHLVFAFERQDGTAPLLVGLLDTPAAEAAAGIARDSLARILSILSTGYGTAAADQVGRLPRAPTAMSALARLDWSAGARHLVTLRQVSTRWDDPLSGGVDQPIALREARSDFRSREHQTLVALRSTLSSRSHNELRVGMATSSRTLEPVSPGLPRGFVQVRSRLPDGTIGNVTVQFGGNRLAPDRSREWQLQLVDVVRRQTGPFELAVGTDNTVGRYRSLVAEGQSGLFVFPSIDALAARQPIRFARSVPLSGTSPETGLTTIDLGAFAQAVWRPSRRFSLTGGLRWDASVVASRPHHGPSAAAHLGDALKRRASDWLTISPRGQVVWDIRGDGDRLLRAGIGLFPDLLPAYTHHNQLLNTGDLLAEVDRRGGQVPVPDYPAYRTDPASVPGLSDAAPAPYVNLVGASWRLPTTWKASASYTHRLAPGWTVTGTALGSWSRGLYHYIDKNLRAKPAFGLDAERGRGVYVPAATIGANGLTDVRNAVTNRALGRVLALESPGRARMVGAALEVGYQAPTDRGRLDLSYAWADARDNSTFGCCLARTAAAFTPVTTDPRDLSATWAPSDLAVRHRIAGAGWLALTRAVSVAGRLAVASGRRYSLVVDGDVNGDEVNGNDLAFLFDPDDPTTPADVAASMRRILADPENLASDYIRHRLGNLAERNGLETPWVVRLDLRVASRLSLGRLPRATITLDLYNALNLIDADWGAERMLPLGISNQNPIVNRVPLLRIVGFDQATERYRYAVNEQAGMLPRGGNPFQFQIGVRIDR